MKKIEITNVVVDGNSIHYQVQSDPSISFVKQGNNDLFITYHWGRDYGCNLSSAPTSILLLPLSLYLLPFTYFYSDIELVIPEMDKVLYDQLPTIYEAYSKIYGPFKPEWRGKLTVGKVVENIPFTDAKYDKVVFFSGGVDACHAGINNPGKNSLLVSIPDIERDAVDEGPLRDEKFSLIKNFSDVVKSDWLLISNNFNRCLFIESEISKYLKYTRKLDSPAYRFDGWGGIRYLANMCCVAPVSFLTGVKSLVMGSSFEQIENDMQINYDGANPDLTNSIVFANTSFAEQDGPTIRRSVKVANIIKWCKKNNVKTKMWACFTNGSVQCGYCGKCVRTQLNILCTGENPKDWGFENFSEKDFEEYVRAYRYVESNPCWMWDNIETIDNNTTYPYCNDLLHWLKSIGYKKYHIMAQEHAKPTILKKLLNFKNYPQYIKIVLAKIFNK